MYLKIFQLSSYSLCILACYFGANPGPGQVFGQNTGPNFFLTLDAKTRRNGAIFTKLMFLLVPMGLKKNLSLVMIAPLLRVLETDY